jgi:two-component system CheB/CheR fusion protein
MALRPLRVFIADDNRDQVMLLGILFRSEGMVVQSTTRGAEVRSAVARFRPDAVLLDIAMPDRSGLELALEITRDFGTRCPVLIAVTAHSSEVARRLTAKSGFRHHVGKPYDPDALLKLVAAVQPQD